MKQCYKLYLSIFTAELDIVFYKTLLPETELNLLICHLYITYYL